MESVIMPREGIGPVRIGMSKDAVKRVLGEPTSRFMQGPFAEAETESFHPRGIQVDYDKNGMVNFISATSAARPTFQGRPVVGMPFEECKAWFKQFDISLETDATGFSSSKLGISVFASGAMKEPSDPVEAVSIFTQGYYD